MQQHGSKYFTRRPPVSKGQNSTFSEHGWVAYQIKGNHECSNMVANSLPPDPCILGVGSKVHNSTFSEYGHVAYQIKGNILSLHTFNLWVGLKGKKNLNVVMLHIKLRGKEYRLT